MVSYMSFAWQTFLEHLRTFASKDVDDGKLWLSILQTISKSIAADEDRGSYRNYHVSFHVSSVLQFSGATISCGSCSLWSFNRSLWLPG